MMKMRLVDDVAWAISDEEYEYYGEYCIEKEEPTAYVVRDSSGNPIYSNADFENCIKWLLGTMKDKKMNAIINTLMGYLRCDKETATLMFNGVQTFNGDKYSAYMNENRLAIYKNGIIIERLQLL